MNKRTKRFLAFISWIPLVVLLIWIFNLNQDKKNAMSDETSITVGQILKYEVVPRSPDRFIYSYKVNKVNYKAGFLLTDQLNRISEDSLKKFLGRRYEVEYSVSKPEFSELLISKPVK